MHATDNQMTNTNLPEAQPLNINNLPVAYRNTLVSQTLTNLMTMSQKQRNEVSLPAQVQPSLLRKLPFMGQGSSKPADFEWPTDKDINIRFDGHAVALA